MAIALRALAKPIAIQLDHQQARKIVEPRLFLEFLQQEYARSPPKKMSDRFYSPAASPGCRAVE